MALEEANLRPAPRARPAVWYRSWRFYAGCAVVLLVYGYGWRITQIHLAELWRGARLIEPFVVALSSPDILTREPRTEGASAPFYYGGQAPPAPPTPSGPRLVLSPRTGPIGTRIRAEGRGFAPGRPGVLWWENQIGQRQQVASFVTDSQGRFAVGFTAPPAQGTRNLVVAEVTTGAGPLRPSPTLVVVVDRMIETIFLALMGTTMGVLFAVPLSFLGARNLTSHVPGGGVVYALTRACFNLTRSI